MNTKQIYIVSMENAPFQLETSLLDAFVDDRMEFDLLYSPGALDPATTQLARLYTTYNFLRELEIKRDQFTTSTVNYIWIGLKKVAKAASFTASLKVGCPWQVRAISSVAAPYSIARTHS